MSGLLGRIRPVDAAASVAPAEGLEGITPRGIGERLGVRPGLVSHCFPVVDELVAEAVGQVVGAELDILVPPGRAGSTPVERLAHFFVLATGEGHGALSRLWINARHLSRYRPVLRDRAGRQETQWRERLAQLIQDGVGSGRFRTADPCASAVQILVDGHIRPLMGAELAHGPDLSGCATLNEVRRALARETGTLAPERGCAARALTRTSSATGPSRPPPSARPSPLSERSRA
ncbi:MULTISPECIES: TetR/AcrR family transcriptional regulator [unclassified Streptomyces]|uniref:TetR/AcrR family transcriptional regulator n=1 Tax=unclassified Streptomyces TaxID=2593676 RepID=UPI0035D58FAC